MKKNAILIGPCLGEMYWEFGRFVPYFLWKRLKEYKNRKDVDFIVMTRPENFDMYGKYASVLVPFRLKNNSEYKPNCFRLDNLSNDDYLSIINIFGNQFVDRYDILEFVYPKIGKKDYSNKNQFDRNKTSYNYAPRIKNKELIEKYLDEKPVIVLSPRFREGFKRNWPYWNELYDMIYNNKELNEKYNFVICGKKPDYVPDLKNRFLDINSIEQNMHDTSLIGLTMECIKKGILTIGSQSAIPNISLLFGVHALEWGHQKTLHTITYNIRKTKVTFLEDMKYDISPIKVYDEMIKILK